MLPPGEAGPGAAGGAVPGPSKTWAGLREAAQQNKVDSTSRSFMGKVGSKKAEAAEGGSGWSSRFFDFDSPEQAILIHFHEDAEFLARLDIQTAK